MSSVPPRTLELGNKVTGQRHGLGGRDVARSKQARGQLAKQTLTPKECILVARAWDTHPKSLPNLPKAHYTWALTKH